MGFNSNISWTDHTFNPWIGCTKVSPGCANCYAAQQDKFRKWTPEGWGAGKPRRRTSESNWKQPLKWNRDAGKAKYGPRPRVFCASLADWLDDEVPIEWLIDLLDVIRRTPNLDWQLLTKRPQNWEKRIALAFHVLDLRKDAGSRGVFDMVTSWISGIAFPENVWIGTTVEDQKRAKERIPHLLSIPARVRFLSCEPLLEMIEIQKEIDYCTNTIIGPAMVAGIHWVICGGESGPGAREFNEEWARNLKSQCRNSVVPFFMKQMGSRPVNPSGVALICPDRNGTNPNLWPEDLRVQEFPVVGGAE